LIIVADHSKFGKVCPIPVVPIARASKLVTDAGASPDEVARLQETGIQVIIASPEPPGPFKVQEALQSVRMAAAK
jgi:DeoR/GlpR family transcriptional regulator of sugar metabolism